MKTFDFTRFPFDEITSFGRRHMLYHGTFAIGFMLGRYCNYNCSYCWPQSRSNTKDHRPTEVITGTIDEIKRQARENGFTNFTISFTGGEPTLHPGFLDIVKHYGSDNKTAYQLLNMSTNMSQGLKWWQKFCKASSDIHDVEISASWHREAGWKDMKKHMEQFAEKLHLLSDNAVNYEINIVMVPQLWDHYLKEAEYFHDNGLNITLRPMSIETGQVISPDYTEDMLNFLKTGFPKHIVQSSIKRSAVNLPPIPSVDNDLNFEMEYLDQDGKRWFLDTAERMNSLGISHFKGWQCNAGFQSVVISEPDGSVKRGHSCSDDILGNVETGFELFKKPKICKTSACMCSFDSKVPKSRS